MDFSTGGPLLDLPSFLSFLQSHARFWAQQHARNYIGEEGRFSMLIAFIDVLVRVPQVVVVVLVAATATAATSPHRGHPIQWV